MVELSYSYNRNAVSSLEQIVPNSISYWNRVSVNASIVESRSIKIITCIRSSVDYKVSTFGFNKCGTV